MALFEGRVLITYCPNKDDRDAVIENILNHKSCRATLYIMVKDFRDIPDIRATFPTVLPFVLIPRKDINTTRQLLKFLPHMDHFVNFLGQEVALEFLNQRNDFRIKDISMAYAQTNVVNKILNSKGQGIVFNVAANDNKCMTDVAAVGISAKKSFQDIVKKVVSTRAGTSSSNTDENKPLLPKDDETHGYGEGRSNGHGSGNENSSRNTFWRFLISLFYYICPCVKDTRVVLPVNRYPHDLDMKMKKEFEQLYARLGFERSYKINEAEHLKNEALQALQDEKEHLVQKEVIRLTKDKKDITTSRASNAIALLSVSADMKKKKERIKEEYKRRLDELYIPNYDNIIEEQINMLISFWKTIRLT